MPPDSLGYPFTGVIPQPVHLHEDHRLFSSQMAISQWRESAMQFWSPHPVSPMVRSDREMANAAVTARREKRHRFFGGHLCCVLWSILPCCAFCGSMDHITRICCIAVAVFGWSRIGLQPSNKYPHKVADPPISYCKLFTVAPMDWHHINQQLAYAV